MPCGQATAKCDEKTITAVAEDSATHGAIAQDAMPAASGLGDFCLVLAGFAKGRAAAGD